MTHNFDRFAKVAVLIQKAQDELDRIDVTGNPRDQGTRAAIKSQLDRPLRAALQARSEGYDEHFRGDHDPPIQ